MQWEYGQQLELPPACFLVDFGGGCPHMMCTWGELGYIGGAKGVGKTTWSVGLQASALSARVINRLQFLLGNQYMVTVDSETSQAKWYQNNNMVYTYGGVKGPDPRHIAISSLEYPTAEAKRKQLHYVLQKYGHYIGLIILDRVDHFLDNPNDIEKSRLYINYLKQAANKLQCVIIGITHTTGDDAHALQSNLYGAFGREWHKSCTFGFIAEEYQRTYILNPKDTRYSARPPRIEATMNDNSMLEELPFNPW